MPAIDLKRLAAEISVQHGIRVDPDDPMMAVVTLNRLMLEATVEEIVASLQSATRELQDAAERVQLQAGVRLAKEIRDVVSAVEANLRTTRPTSVPDTEPSPPHSGAGNRWVRQLIVAGLVFLVGVGVGIGLPNAVKNSLRGVAGKTLGVQCCR